MAAESTPSTQEILAGQLEAGPTPLLVRELSVRVAGRTLLRDVDIELRRGELVALVGHSGSGKSVLLRIIAGLIRGDESGFEISGELLIASQDGFARRRPSVGVVFQRFALFDELTPEENLAFALSHRDRRATRAERERVHELAVSLGIHDLPAIAHCSIGQQQRVKCAFDPDGLLNPGKVFPQLHRCAELGRMHVHKGKLAFPDLPRF